MSNGSNGYSMLEGRSRTPCRRTCSTIHNPMFHVTRFNTKKTNRPMSAKEKRPNGIDWIDSELYEIVK